MDRFKALIFDMDGLLLDSERIALKTFLAACESAGFVPQSSVYLNCIGCNAEKSREILLNGYGPNFPYEEVMSHWDKNYAEQAFLKKVPLKPGVNNLLASIAAHGLPMAVATSTALDKATLKLKNAHILHYFKFIVAGDQVRQSKPHPEIYLKAAEKLEIRPEHCLALEDSDNGVKAAFAAGMTVFQVPDLVAPADEVKALGHKIINSLQGFETLLFSDKS